MENSKTNLKTEFGKIIAGNKTYSYDIIIDVGGEIRKRSNISEKLYGTHHVICTEEIKELTEKKPEVIIIGLGQYNSCRLEPGVERECSKNNIKLVAEATPKAVEIFNTTKERKAGLFHVTC